MATTLKWRLPQTGCWKLLACVFVGCPLLVIGGPTQDPPKTPKTPPTLHPTRPVRVHYGRSVVRRRPQAEAAVPLPAVPTPIVVPIDPAILARDRANYLAALAAASAAADARHQQAMIGVDARVVAFLKEQTENGSAYAPFDLAGHYREGKGVELDRMEADRLVRLAAARGNDDAKNWLREHPSSGTTAGASNPPPARGFSRSV